jgi:hypothetical protein
MKRFVFAIAIMAMLSYALLVPFATGASAAEKILSAEVTATTMGIDKNGNAYVRLIVTETRNIGSVSYEIGIPAMCFGSQLDAASEIKSGDTVKAVVQAREFEGRSSYTILKILE